MGIINEILNFFKKKETTINNDLILRLTNDKQSSFYVFDNQIESALDVIENFKKGNRWCLLMAEMQSGKSGTFFSVPYIIARNQQIKTELGLSDGEINMFLLTPMSDSELVQQFEQDIVNFTGVEIKRNVIHNNEMQKFLKTPKDEWTTTDVNTINKMKENSVILIDESHYGSDKNQILNQFLENILEISATGESTLLNKKNIYVLSISATPMAERISVDDTTIKKKIIPLKNTKEYFGIIGMWETNKIKQSFNLNNKDGISDLVKVINTLPSDGYILVRANDRGDKDIEDIIKEIPNEIECINYNQETKKSIFSNTDINDILSVKPIGRKIIFFKGKLRAGQRVKTEHVIMVHDSHKSTSDTTAQSFLGRCCGYNKNRNIEIYCDLKSAKEYYEWVKSGFAKLSTPKAKNVSKEVSKITTKKLIEYPIIKTIYDDEIINLLDKKNKTVEEKIKIVKHLNEPILNDILNDDNFIISRISRVSDDNKNSTYQKNYVDLKDGIFFGYYKQDGGEENLGKVIIIGAFNSTINELVIIPGMVVDKIGVPELSIVSMYSETA